MLIHVNKPEEVIRDCEVALANIKKVQELACDKYDKLPWYKQINHPRYCEIPTCYFAEWTIRSVLEILQLKYDKETLLDASELRMITDWVYKGDNYESR